MLKSNTPSAPRDEPIRLIKKVDVVNIHYFWSNKPGLVEMKRRMKAFMVFVVNPGFTVVIVTFYNIGGIWSENPWKNEKRIPNGTVCWLIRPKLKLQNLVMEKKEAIEKSEKPEDLKWSGVPSLFRTIGCENSWRFFTRVEASQERKRNI